MSRKESRGAHTRSDYPKKDNETLARKHNYEGEGRADVSGTCPSTKPTQELAALIKE